MRYFADDVFSSDTYFKKSSTKSTAKKGLLQWLHSLVSKCTDKIPGTKWNLFPLPQIKYRRNNLAPWMEPLSKQRISHLVCSTHTLKVCSPDPKRFLRKVESASYILEIFLQSGEWFMPFLQVEYFKEICLPEFVVVLCYKAVWQEEYLPYKVYSPIHASFEYSPVK